MLSCTYNQTRHTKKYQYHPTTSEFWHSRWPEKCRTVFYLLLQKLIHLRKTNLCIIKWFFIRNLPNENLIRTNSCQMRHSFCYRNVDKNMFLFISSALILPFLFRLFQIRTSYNGTWHKSNVLEDDPDTLTIVSILLVGKCEFSTNLCRLHRRLNVQFIHSTI